MLVSADGMSSPYAIDHAFILTCDSSWTYYGDGCLVVDSGRIEWIGDSARLPERYSDIRRIDGNGLVVLPGLVNTHSHAGLSLLRGLCDEGDLFSWAGTIGPSTSQLTLADVAEGARIAVDAMLDAGVTCACDCTRYGAGIFADVASKRGLRSISGALANSPELRPDGHPNWPAALDETRAALDRHNDDQFARFFLGAHAPYSCTTELVSIISSHALDEGLRFVIHLAETQREVRELKKKSGLSPTQWLDSIDALGPSTLLAHGVWLTGRDLDLVAERGAAIAHCPTSNAKLSSGIAPVRAILDRGIPMGLGTDSMLSNNAQDILLEARQCSLLQRVRSESPTMLTTREVLELATSGGARALGWDDEIGSLAPGKAADFVAIAVSHPRGLTLTRAMSDLVYSVGRSEIRLVITDGEVRRDFR